MELTGRPIGDIVSQHGLLEEPWEVPLPYFREDVERLVEAIGRKPNADQGFRSLCQWAVEVELLAKPFNSEQPG